MVDTFTQRKKRAIIKTCVYSGAMGISAALLVFSTLFLIFKLTEGAFPWYGYLFACLAAVLVCGTLLLFLYPTDKRFARALDRKYALDEKVQTMVEYDEKEGAILALQRAQTNEILATLPKKKPTAFDIVKWIVAPILAIAMTVTAFVVPEKEVSPTPPPEQPPTYIQPDDFLYRDMLALIENVKKSGLTEDLLPAYVAGLETIAELVNPDAENGGTVEEGTATLVVQGALDMFAEITKEDNSYHLFVNGLKETENLKPLSTAISDSGNVYKTIADIKLKFFSTVEGKEDALFKAIEKRWAEYGTTITSNMDKMSDEQYLAYLERYQASLEDLLAQESIVALPTITPPEAEEEGKEPPTPDGIKVALLAHNSSIKNQIVNLNTYFADPVNSGLSMEGIKDLVGDGFELLYADNNTWNIVEPLRMQAHSVLIKDYTINEVVRIFDGVLKLQVPQEEEEATTENSTGDNQGGAASPGEGGGSAYPNAGEVLDPSDGTYKPYGEILNDGYFAKVEALLNDPNVSQELKDYLSAYFDGLMEN